MTANTDTSWVAFYLRDHMALATAGVNLFARVADGHSKPHVRAQVARLGEQMREDRSVLAQVMTDLGVRQISITMLAAVVGEVAGRFKPNGAISGRSPGADVLELEALAAAVAGKAQLWQTLQGQAHTDSRLDAGQFNDLQERAHQQLQVLHALHAQVVDAEQQRKRGDTNGD